TPRPRLRNRRRNNKPHRPKKRKNPKHPRHEKQRPRPKRSKKRRQKRSWMVQAAAFPADIPRPQNLRLRSSAAVHVLPKHNLRPKKPKPHRSAQRAPSMVISPTAHPKAPSSSARPPSKRIRKIPSSNSRDGVRSSPNTWSTRKQYRPM